MYREAILRRTGLLDGLGEEELASVADSCTTMEAPAGTVILREGEEGNELYVVLNGAVEVFTQAPDGTDVPLARREEGHYFGEQALLPSGDRRRNASVRCTTPVTLLRVPRGALELALAKDRELGEKLRALGADQVRRKLVRQSAAFRTVPADFLEGSLCEEVRFTDGEVIFREGDPGDYLYLVVSGAVEIHREEAGRQKLIVRLEPGQCFGELALIDREPRAATATAHGAVVALRMAGERFVGLYGRSPELREYVKTLQRVYPMPGRGFVTQHAGEFLGLAAITTMYRLADGTTAIASNVVGQEIYHLSLASGGGEGAEVLRHGGEAHDIERELRLVDGRLVEMTVRGPWSELRHLHRMVLEREALSTAQIESFRATGVLHLEPEPSTGGDDEIVCNCLQIARGTLLSQVERGHDSVEKLGNALGAGTVCRGCTAQLRTLLGRSRWTPVHCSKVIRQAADVRSFRFEPPSGVPFAPARAGQHVVVQALIRGKWAERPYTITSPAGETSFREISVKALPHGLFSRWLLDERRDEDVIRLSDPEGAAHVDPSDSHPVVCLVAGIGVTPAVAVCRTLVRQGGSRVLHVDYTGSSRGQMAFADELETAARDHENITVDIRATEERGRIRAGDVEHLCERFPNARFHVCGPRGYQLAVQDHLIRSGVHAGRIHVEEFTTVAGGDGARRDLPSDAAVSAIPPRGYIAVGVLLVAAFALQSVLDVEWPWLQAVQAGESYRRWSGAALALFVAFQWYLPVLRLLGRSHTQAGIRQYHWHKRVGVLAPVAFYAHSTRFGHAYLLALSLVYFGNVVIGLLNKEIFRDLRRRERYVPGWTSVHVALSVALVALTAYHVLIVFYYK